jgi:hypothetical protein
MARPIKETPVLYGEDARRFERQEKKINWTFWGVLVGIVTLIVMILFKYL